MANILDRFQKTVVGASGRFADFTDVISPIGDFTRTAGLNVILKSWYNLLITPTRTVDHDPEYGSDLYKLVFAPADEDTKQEILDEVVGKIQFYDNRARIKAASVDFLQNKKGFVLNILAEYKGESGEIKATIDQTTFEVVS